MECVNCSGETFEVYFEDKQSLHRCMPCDLLMNSVNTDNLTFNHLLSPEELRI